MYEPALPFQSHLNWVVLLDPCLTAIASLEEPVPHTLETKAVFTMKLALGKAIGKLTKPVALGELGIAVKPH